jgi:hypothetical protein
VAVVYPIIVVAVDPGGTTGIAVFKFTEHAVEYVEHHQWEDPNTAWRAIHNLVHYWQSGYEVVLVVEQFDKRPGVINPDFTPKYINRDIENNIDDVEIVWQIPADAMNLVKPVGKKNHGPDHLKRFGWYLRSNVHANDAARHAIVYGVNKLKHMPLILRGWPKPKDDD